VLDLDQDPWPDGIREIPERAWNNTVIHLRFLAEPVLTLRCTAASDVLAPADAEDLVAGIATSLGDLLYSLSSEHRHDPSSKG
jgi:hypothetical protein